MRHHLVLFLAIRAVYQGRLDLTAEWEQIAEPVEKLAGEADRGVWPVLPGAEGA